MNYSALSKVSASLLLVGALAACGGGSSGPAAVAGAPEAPAPTSFTVEGTAATGAVFDNATVTITASDGATFPADGEAAVVTGADGSYTITLPIEAKPPFVVQAARDDQTLVSVVAEATDTTTNITPVTNLIASRLSSSGDPAMLATELKDNPSLFDAAAVKAKVAEIVALLQPLMDALGDSTDPLNGKFVADGTGADKLLDSLSITITPSSGTTVNIAVSVKQKQAEGEQPVVIAFTGGSNATAPSAALPAVTAADLVPSGTATLIADFLQRATACYAVAPADRVTSGGTAATDIVAPACKDIFVGNDPASYKHNGGVVSKTGGFSGIFGTGTGVTFDRGSYEFTRGNGDLVIAFRATSSEGNSSNIVLVVRADTDGKLRAIGNQYKYDGGVNATASLRTFVNQPEASSYDVGYTLSVNNVLDADGNSIFAKVVATSPRGGVLTLKPLAGSPTLRLAKGETQTRTQSVYIRGAYVDPATSGNPADSDTTLFWVPTADQRSDEEIAAIGAQATWKFDYYLASDPATIAETQYYKTRARPLTIAELKTRPLATLADADIANLKADSGTPATGPITLNWVVPTGALPPTLIQAFGRVPNGAGGSVPFDNRNASIGSSALSGEIACSKASASDTHCDSAGNYASGGFLQVVALSANDATGRNFGSAYAMYPVTIP